MAEFITDRIISPETFNNLTMVDIRTITPAQREQYENIIRTALGTIPSALYCGDADNLALQQAIDDAGGVMSAEDQLAFLASYDAQAPTRMTENEVMGRGMMKFAVFNSIGTMMGAISIMRASILNIVGREVQVRATPSFFRSGVRVFNASRTALTSQFTQDQATFYRFLLNTTFDVDDSSLTVKVMIVDPHAKNSRYETLQATIDYDAALTSIMQTFLNVTVIPSLEGSRAYNIYGRV